METLTHKKGDIVKIYSDPLTEQNLEGEAELINKTPNYSPKLENWMVQFKGEKWAVYRWIKKD